jgi:putative hemolysin
MNTIVLRRARNILTGALLAGVAATTVVSAAHTVSQAGSAHEHRAPAVSAMKEGRSVVAQPAMKEGRTVVRPAMKEGRTVVKPVMKEGRSVVKPAMKESAPLA